MKTFTKKLTLLTVLACAAVSTYPANSSDILNSISKTLTNKSNLVVAGFFGIWSGIALYSLWNAKSQPVNKDSIDKVSIDQIAQAITDINNAFDAATAREVETTIEVETQTAEALALEAQSLNLIELVLFATKSPEHAKAALIEINRIIAYQKEIAKKSISGYLKEVDKKSNNFGMKNSKTPKASSQENIAHEIKCQKEREAAAERYYDYK